MSNIDDFDPLTARGLYLPSLTEQRRARLWEIEKSILALDALGVVNLFKGAGTDPTALTGYNVDYLWLQASSGVTDEPGVVRYYDGAGDATDISNWPKLTDDSDLEGIRSHLSLYSKTEVDALFVGGLPSLTSDNFSNASTVTGTTISDALETLLAALANKVETSTLGANSGVATLDGSGKLTSAQIPDSITSPFRFIGTWDADANTLAPVGGGATSSLADGVGTEGDLVRISVAGTTSLDGNATWAIGDEAYFGGGVWNPLGGSTSVAAVASPLSTTSDSSAGGYAITNLHGGGKWRAHWTKDQRSIVIYGDQAALGFDPAGDSWGPFVVPWDSANNGNITAMYAGLDYLLFLTDQTTGNLWHMGATGEGQGGLGATSGVTLTPARITQFVTDAVKIASVTTEANFGNSESFWFAVTTTGLLYSCGYSGAEHVMGYNNTANLSTPRKMTESDGTTALANISRVYASTAVAPVWAVTTGGVAYRWGAGTDGAHGNNDTVAMTWPDALETTHGSGTDRTDIAEVQSVGANSGGTRAVTWLRTTAGKVEVSGSIDHGNGNGDAPASGNIDLFASAAGAIDTKTVTKIVAGGGHQPVCMAITDEGSSQVYIVGAVDEGLIGDGSTSDIGTFAPLSGLPSGFDGSITDARVAGAYTGTSYHALYLEATNSSIKSLASIGYGANYATADGNANIAAASRTWVNVVGAQTAIQSWQSVGESAIFGLELIDADGRLWYAGGNDQGQGGVQTGNLHSVPYMQPCMLSGDRVAKAPTHNGPYSAIDENSYNDIRELNGSSWIYINATATTGNSPPTLPTTSNTYWQLVAAQGDTGATGAAGPTGATGATGSQGATGADGAVATVDTVYDNGTQSSGTFTPDPANGRAQEMINNGDFDLVAPTTAGAYSFKIALSNGASAGAIYFEGFDRVTGDTLTTVQTDKFWLEITRVDDLVNVNIDKQAAFIVPLLVFNGESNAGGFGLNANALGAEVVARSAVQILNNTSLTFETLDIATNNLIDHDGFVHPFEANYHGLENGIASAVEAGLFSRDQIYLIKTGQGGSSIASWDVGDASGYWTKFLDRVNAAKVLMAAAGVTYEPYVFYSQGINDAVAGTPVATWKAATIAHLAKIRAELGATTHVIMTRFVVPPLTSGDDVYNTAIDEIAAADAYTTVVDTSDLDSDGTHHWVYQGLRVLADRVVDEIGGTRGTLSDPVLSVAAGSYGSTQSVSITGPDSAVIRWTADGSEPTIRSRLYTGPISVSITATIKARAFRRGWKRSAEVSAAYTITSGAVAEVWSAADASAQGFTLSNSDRTAVRSSSGAWRSIRSVTSHASGKYYFELRSSNSSNQFAYAGLATSAFDASVHLSGGPGSLRVGASSAAGNGFTVAVSVDLPTLLNGTVAGFAVDAAAGKIWFSADGVWQGGGNPETGDTPFATYTPGSGVFPAASLYDPGTNWTLQASHVEQTYDAPVGFEAWV